MHPLPGNVIPIAQLSPNNDSLDGTFRGVVTVIWPYSISKQSISLLLAERDFRLRRKRGQVRITFRGHSAAAVAQAKVSSGDELALSLDGAIFQPDAAKEQTPGRGIEWQLVYSRRLNVLIKREGEQQTPLVVNRSTPTPEPEAGSPLAAAEGAVESPPRSPPVVDKNDQFWESPAFLRHRAAYDHPFLSSFNFDDDDDDSEHHEGAKRSKRTKFGRQSGQWRFADRHSTTTKSRSVSEGVSLGSKSAREGRSESRTPELLNETDANLEPVDGLFIPGPFDVPDDGIDDFQQLSKGILATPVDDFEQLATPNMPLPSSNDSAPFATGQALDAVQDLTSLDVPIVGTENTFQSDPSASIPPSDFLTSPEFQTFPTEVSPLFDKTNSAETRPVHEPTDMSNIEPTHTLLQNSSPPPPQPPEDLIQNPGQEASASALSEQPTVGEFEGKGGTANKPIEIIDLDSDSSSADTPPPPPVAPEHLHEEQASVYESASEDDEDRELPSSKVERSEDESIDDERLHAEESSEDDEDEPISEAELDQFRRKFNQGRKASQGSEGSSLAESEADAEGEEYDDDHDIHETRRLSASSPSQQSEASSDIQPSTRKQQHRLSDQSPAYDISKHSSESVVESDDEPSDVSNHEPGRRSSHEVHLREEDEEGTTNDKANHDILHPTESDPIDAPTATQSKKSPTKVVFEQPLSPIARLVTRGRPGDSETALQNGAQPHSVDSKLQTTSKPSDEVLSQSLKEQNQRIITKPTVNASTIAKTIKQSFVIGQNASFEGFRTPLSYFTTIANFAQYYSRQIDIIAVVTGQTKIQQAKKGPREFFTTLKLADPWSEEIGSPAYTSAQIYRRKEAALPECGVGDAIMLRQFKIQQRKQNLHLLSCKDSAWAVFTQKHDEQVSVRGPPVELGPEEKQLAEGLQQWWAAMEHTAATAENGALNEESQKEPRMKAEVLDTTPPASPERHVLRDGASYADGPGEAVHKLRDGATYSD